jgi:hypothetical protein
LSRRKPSRQRRQHRRNGLLTSHLPSPEPVSCPPSRWDFFGADHSGMGGGGNQLTRSCSQLQHHVEPDAGCQDSRRLAAPPPHQEARHCSQVRRLRHQAPRCKLVCDFERCVRGDGWFWTMRVTNDRPNDEPIPILRGCRHREASLNGPERTRLATPSSTIPRADAPPFMSRALEQHNDFGTWKAHDA